MNAVDCPSLPSCCTPFVAKTLEKSFYITAFVASILTVIGWVGLLHMGQPALYALTFTPPLLFVAGCILSCRHAMQKPVFTEEETKVILSLSVGNQYFRASNGAVILSNDPTLGLAFAKGMDRFLFPHSKYKVIIIADGVPPFPFLNIFEPDGPFRDFYNQHMHFNMRECLLLFSRCAEEETGKEIAERSPTIYTLCERGLTIKHLFHLERCVDSKLPWSMRKELYGPLRASLSYFPFISF
jgi:hypothetical protein